MKLMRPLTHFIDLSKVHILGRKIYIHIQVGPYIFGHRHFFIILATDQNIFKRQFVTKLIDTGRRRREEGGGNRRTFNTFNNKINKHKWKAAAPHGRLPHTKHKLKSRPGPLSSSTVVTPHLTLPKLLRGTRDWWMAQVSFITIYSTGLAPFPRLSAPPHSPHSYIMNMGLKCTLWALVWGYSNQKWRKG